jgi:hypothetical protein
VSRLRFEPRAARIRCYYCRLWFVSIKLYSSAEGSLSNGNSGTGVNTVRTRGRTTWRLLHFPSVIMPQESRDSAVRIATGYGPDDRGSEFESWWGQEFSLLHVIQTGSGVHPTSYLMGTGGSFHRGKATALWSWPLTSNYCRGQEKWIYTSTPPYAFTV